LIEAKIAKLDYREQLADSIGLPVSALLDTVFAYDFSRRASHTLTLHHLRRQALRHRPDILEALEEYSSAVTLLRKEIERGGLRFELKPGCQWASDRNRWVVRLEEGLPVLDQTGKTITEASARHIAAAAHLLNLQAGIIDELDQAEAVYRMTEREVSTIAADVVALERQHIRMRARYMSGLTTASELLISRLYSTAAQIANLEAQVKLQGALGALEDVVHQRGDWAGLTDPRNSNGLK